MLVDRWCGWHGFGDRLRVGIKTASDDCRCRRGAMIRLLRVAALLLAIGGAISDSWASDGGGCTLFLATTEPTRVLPACHRLADQGDADAQFTLGFIYGMGRVVQRDD